MLIQVVLCEMRANGIVYLVIRGRPGDDILVILPHWQTIFYRHPPVCTMQVATDPPPFPLKTT